MRVLRAEARGLLGVFQRQFGLLQAQDEAAAATTRMEIVWRAPDASSAAASAAAEADAVRPGESHRLYAHEVAAALAEHSAAAQAASAELDKQLLPRLRYLLRWQAEDTGSCCVCLEPLGSAVAVFRACAHMVCAEHIPQLRRLGHRTCPLCKGPVSFGENTCHTARDGIVFARVGDSKGRDGITSFIVDKSRAGISLSKIPVIRSYAPYEVHFDNYEVPVEDRLGEEGKGFAFAEEWLIHARPPYAAATIGIAQAALELAIEWASQRKTFGSLLADKQAIQWMIADSEVELRAARLLVYQAAWNADRGRDIKVDASVAKVYGTEVAGRVVDRCIQIFGGMGVAQALPLERWYRELRIKRIGEGPSEVHRMVIARELLGGRRAKA